MTKNTIRIFLFVVHIASFITSAKYEQFNVKFVITQFL